MSVGVERLPGAVGGLRSGRVATGATCLLLVWLAGLGSGCQAPRPEPQPTDDWFWVRAPPPLSITLDGETRQAVVAPRDRALTRVLQVPPAVSRPGTVAPAVSRPGTVAPAVSRPGTVAPAVPQPDNGGPSLTQAGAPAPAIRLDFAVGLTCPPGKTCQGARTFRVQARSGTQTHALFERTLNPEPGGHWSEARVDLHALAGQTVELRFHVEPVSAPAPEGISEPTPLWSEPTLVTASPAPSRPNVLLISIDTLRADHLGCYGYSRETSPVLDRLAADAVLFRNAISQAPWTTPSHMSLMTSLYPSVHRVNQGSAELRTFLRGGGPYRVLDDDTPTLAQLLRAEGYRTLALTGGGPMSAEFGFARGFDVYRQNGLDADPQAWSTLEDWLEAYRQVPFFLFFHTFEVHAPYTRDGLAGLVLQKRHVRELRQLWRTSPRNRRRAQMQYLQREDLYRPEVTAALYDSGIRHVDNFLGRLFEKLRALGLFDRTLIVVTSDHGEEFAEHDPERFYNAHCTTVYDELIRVPLILHLPGRFRPGTLVEPPVELIDVAPTVLELAGLPVHPSMQGHSLVSLAEGATARPQDWTLSEATCRGPEIRALRTARLKYVAQFGTPAGGDSDPLPPIVREQLFDLRADPGEHQDLHQVDPHRTSSFRKQLISRLESLRSVARSGRAAQTSERDRQNLEERLRALGYVN